MAKKKKDYSRQILERIVGTKRKTEIADKLNKILFLGCKIQYLFVFQLL